MEKLKQYINEKGIIVNASVLKVDSFMNHQIDPVLMDEIGKEFAEHFKSHNITKIVTIESSGIAPAVFAGLHLNVPVVFARKGTSLILNNDIAQSPVYSYTKEHKYTVTIAKEYLNENDNILFIDDFLANGQSLLAIHKIITDCNAKIVGAGIVIEKSFQAGVAHAEELGIEVYSLAKIKKLYANKIEFE